MKKTLKKNFTFLVVFIFITTIFISGMSARNISENNNLTHITENIKIKLENNDEIIQIKYEINNFQIQNLWVDEKIFTQILLDDESNLMIKGEPELPNIRRSIIIPEDKIMEIKVVNAHYEEYENILIVPSKGHLTRDILPENVPYEFSMTYEKDEFYPENIVELESPYFIRDIRGQVVIVNPFQYNPVKKTLRFYKDITVEIFPIGEGGDNYIKNSKPNLRLDSEFKSIYENHFLNFDLIFYDPVEEQGNMIVITYDDFWDAMLPFVQWKNMKGIPTEMIKVSEIGGANDIKNYIVNYYNDEGLTFVILVGDVQQVPTLYASGGASDPSYAYIVGNDHYPDLFVGRFSAQNLAQVETQVQRSIEYEQNLLGNSNWYHQGTGIASNQGPGDDGEYDDEHIDFIRDDLLGFTYALVDQIYDPSGTATQVRNALNDGRSVINYCGHGSAFSWGSTGFDSSDVNDLTNDDMLPFIWSVACNNGEFDNYDSCFAETWLRATNNGEPTGAICALMSSVGQYWNPPMDAQDEFNDLLVGELKSTFGGLSINGCMHMNDEYGSDGWDMTDTWILFGDPSIQVRTDTPETMIVTHPNSIPMGALTIEIEVDSVEGALCAVSQNYELLGYGYTDSTGLVEIEFFDPVPPGGNLDIVVTSFNKLTYFGLISVEGDNEPPEKPQTPEGQNQGAPGETYTYSSTTEDPNGDQIYFMWDWGDGNYSVWIGPINSGETCTESYIWSEKGTYSIKVKAKDIYGTESDWSDPLEVVMPKITLVSLFQNFLEQRFPRIYSFINGVLN